MRGKLARAARLKTSLDFNFSPPILIPIHVYGQKEDLRLVKQHMFHADCGGKIGYKYNCEEHGEVSYSDIEKLVSTIDGQVQITKEELAAIVYGNDTTVKVIQVIDLAEIPRLMSELKIAFGDIYQVRGIKLDKKKFEMSVESSLRVLFDALEDNNQGLLVSLPLDLRRFGLMLPNGTIHTILFEEEIRQDTPMAYGRGEGYSKEYLEIFKKFLNKKVKPLKSTFSVEEIEKKVAGLIDSKPLVFTDKPIEAVAPEAKIADMSSLEKAMKEDLAKSMRKAATKAPKARAKTRR